MQIANNERIYLIYYDIGVCPTDVDDLCIAWTDVLYYVKLRVGMMVNLGLNRAHIKVVPFHTIHEMEQFLTEFDTNVVSGFDLFERRLWLYESVSPIGSKQFGLWTSDEINIGVETVINTQCDFRDIFDCAHILQVLIDLSLLKSSAIIEPIKTLIKLLRYYELLYIVREQFSDDIRLAVEDGKYNDDFCMVRAAFQNMTGLDIVTPNIDQYWHGVFDEVRVLSYLAGLTLI